jgi:carboxymethylenebutenolidase
MNQALTIQVPDGAFQAYVARPEAPSAPVVVVLHEVFGVNNDMRMTCNELAAQGFLAVAPDLFWRQEPGVNLNAWSEPEWQRGLALYLGYDRDQGVKDILATVEAARTLPGASGNVAVMGFCLGALMAFLTAARGEVDAVVAYHGAETEKYLGEASAATAPLLMHLAEEDEFISKEAQLQISAAFAEASNATIHSYPNRNHAFARHTGAHYHAADAALANGRTWSFLSKALA